MAVNPETGQGLMPNSWMMDPKGYNGSYTHDQLEFKNQFMKKRPIMGNPNRSLFDPPMTATEMAQQAQPRPDYAPKRLNTVQSVQATQAPQAPDYTKYEQEAQAQNQIFDGSGQRIPEYVSGAPRSLPPEVLGMENGNTTNFHTQWPDYNRKMAASGGDQGIFMQVGDGPAEFIPQTKNPRYTQARQQRQDDQIAMAQAKIPPPREFNDADSLIKLANLYQQQLASRYDYSSLDYKAIQKRLNDTLALAGIKAGGGQMQYPLMQPDPDIPIRFQQPVQGNQPPVAKPTPTPRSALDIAQQDVRTRLNGGITMQGQPKEQAQNDGEVIVTDPTAGETVIKRADGSFVAILADGRTVLLSPEQVRQAIAQSQGQAR